MKLFITLITIAVLTNCCVTTTAAGDTAKPATKGTTAKPATKPTTPVKPAKPVMPTKTAICDKHTCKNNETISDKCFAALKADCEKCCPPSKTGKLCCKALTATCQACQMNITKAKYCETAPPTMTGCDTKVDKATCAKHTCKTGKLNTTSCKLPKADASLCEKFCCERSKCSTGFTATALACQEGVTVEDYCKTNTTAKGCQVKTSAPKDLTVKMKDDKKKIETELKATYTASKDAAVKKKLKEPIRFDCKTEQSKMTSTVKSVCAVKPKCETHKDDNKGECAICDKYDSEKQFEQAYIKNQKDWHYSKDSKEKANLVFNEFCPASRPKAAVPSTCKDQCAGEFSVHAKCLACTKGEPLEDVFCKNEPAMKECRENKKFDKENCLSAMSDSLNNWNPKNERKKMATIEFTECLTFVDGKDVESLVASLTGDVALPKEIATKLKDKASQVSKDGNKRPIEEWSKEEIKGSKLFLRGFSLVEIGTINDEAIKGSLEVLGEVEFSKEQSKEAYKKVKKNYSDPSKWTKDIVKKMGKLVSNFSGPDVNAMPNNVFKDSVPGIAKDIKIRGMTPEVKKAYREKIKEAKVLPADFATVTTADVENAGALMGCMKPDDLKKIPDNVLSTFSEKVVGSFDTDTLVALDDKLTSLPKESRKAIWGKRLKQLPPKTGKKMMYDDDEKVDKPFVVDTIITTSDETSDSDSKAKVKKSCEQKYGEANANCKQYNAARRRLSTGTTSNSTVIQSSKANDDGNFESVTRSSFSSCEDAKKQAFNGNGVNSVIISLDDKECKNDTDSAGNLQSGLIWLFVTFLLSFIVA